MTGCYPSKQIASKAAVMPRERSQVMVLLSLDVISREVAVVSPEQFQ